ncbi:MAG: hypothetical protein WBC01_04705 [Solirubrobacterales bacterium]
MAIVLALLAFSAAQAQALSLTTAFNSNNGNAGNTFDLEVLKPGGVEVESLDVNVSGAGNTAQIGVWTRPGTSVGFEGSTTGWTSRGSFSVTSAGTDLPTPVPASFSLPAGNYGVAVGVTDYPSVTWQYTNGTPTIFEDAELKLTSQNGLASPLLGGGVFAGRIWNGTINYSQLTAECKLLEAALANADGQLSAANDAASAANDAASAANEDVSAAKKKKKKATQKVKKAKKKLKKAKQSGNANKVKQAKKKLKQAKKKLKKAKKKLKKAKRAATQAQSEASLAQAAANQAQAAFDQACK